MVIAAGWSSSVARRAHNPEVAGSNPAPATRTRPQDSGPGAFAVRGMVPAGSVRSSRTAAAIAAREGQLSTPPQADEPTGRPILRPVTWSVSAGRTTTVTSRMEPYVRGGQPIGRTPRNRGPAAAVAQGRP